MAVGGGGSTNASTQDFGLVVGSSWTDSAQAGWAVIYSNGADQGAGVYAVSVRAG